MIARLWSAQTTEAQASAYAKHFTNHVLPELAAVDGYAGAMLLNREGASGAEILVITLWQSLDAIRRFAGDDLETAVVADEAAAVLTRFDDRVQHYTVAVQDEPANGPAASLR